MAKCVPSSNTGRDNKSAKRLRVVLIGDSNVGKTSLMRRFVLNKFNQKVTSTIDIDEMEKQVEVDGQPFVLRVVDTAGQDRFKSLRQNFYRGTHLCLLTFALDDLASFCNLSMWREEFLYYSDVPEGEQFPFIVIGNKADLTDQRRVSDINAEAWCRAYGGVPYFETSAKQALNVEEVFQAAVLRFLEVQRENSLTSSRGSVRGADPNGVVSLENSMTPDESKRCC